MFDFLGNIFSAFNPIAAIASFLSQLLVLIVQVIVQVSVFLYNLLAAVANFFLKVVQKVGDFVHHIWSGFFKSIIGKLSSLLKTAHDWLEKHLGPIIKYLKSVKARLDAIYRLQIKPLLNLIQHIRQTLLLLRLLHVKFAQQLDAKLAGFQAELIRTFGEARAVVNSLIDAVNILMDPQRLLRRPTLIISLRRSIYATIRAVTGLPPGYFFPSPKRGVHPGLGRIPPTANLRDPAINPPASFWLGGSYDIPLEGFIGEGVPPEDSAVDDLDMLDYFNDELYDSSPCDDPAKCLTVSLQTLASSFRNG